MLLRRSTLAAQRTERPRLAPAWLLLLMGGLIVVALGMIYPQQNLIQRVVLAPESELSSTYVTNLLRTDPDNPQLRLRLATQALEHGELGTLREILKASLATAEPAVQREARWLLWQANALEYKKTASADQRARSARRAELGRQLAQLASEDWPTVQLIAMAGRAFEFGEPAVGVAIYRRVAERSNEAEEAADWYARAAGLALAHGDYQGSAELHLQARRKTADPALGKEYFRTALSTLQSGNLLAEAMLVVDRELGNLANDPDTLLFVTRLARAAGRPDIADRYVRQLLRLSLLRQLEQVRLAEAHGGELPQKVSLRSGSPGNGPQLAFDDKTYTLGYEVFLENRKLEDAWKVAASAVRQSPDDMAWRERLAKVAEWTSRPEMALDNWWLLARRTQRDDAWQSVLRLAPGLFNDKALIAALQYQLSQQPGDFRLLRELVAAWERLGEARTALDYLAHASRQGTRPAVLEMIADLADRAAEPQLALKTWQQLFRDPAEITAPRAIRAATLAMLHDHNGDALQWLSIAQGRSSQDAPQQRELLRLTGQLARLEQRDALAISAFTQLSQGALAEEADFEALIQVLEEIQPPEAARVAIRAWERFGRDKYLIKALNIHTAAQAWDSIGALLGRLSPAAPPPYNTLPALRRQPEFLRLYATYLQNIGHFSEARLELAAALSLAPNAQALQTSMLWLLIEGNDAPGLRRFLAVREPAWRHNPEMHDGLAAAYLSLSRPKIALDRYLTPHLAEHANDFLWLMNYADALDQNQQADRAWRLRRRLLGEEWQAQAQAASKHGKDPATVRKTWLNAANLDETRRLARTRLLITQRGGDTGLDALRELLRLDRNAENHYSPAAMETAIGWLQDAGEYSAERGYLWQQYARHRGKPANQPLWAEISVALASDDVATLRPILETHGERLPRYDRISAAARLGDQRRAQSDAFETMGDQSDDDPLHMQLAESLLDFSDHAGIALARRDLGSLEEQANGAEWHLAVTPKLALDFQLGHIQRQATDQAVLRNVPDERFTSLRIDWRHDDGQTVLLAEQRNSLADYTPLQVEHEHRIDNRLSLRIGLGQHLSSLESTALRVAGMKDRLSFSLSYQPTRLDRITFEQLSERYELQTGSPIGTGNHSTFVIAHALRQESRDLEVSAFWSTHRFNREAQYSDSALTPLLPASVGTVGNLRPGFFLPDNFNFYGLRLSTDMRYQQQYTRALRPYASLARTWHSELGAGYDIRLGLAGAIFGADHFSLTWGLGKGGVQTGGLARELNFNYRLHY